MNWILLGVLGTVAILLAGLVLVRRRTPKPVPAPVPVRQRRAVAVDTGADIVPVPAEAPATEVAEQAPLPPALGVFWLAEEHEILPDRAAQIGERLRQIVMPPRGVQRFMSADIMANDASRELAELVMSEPRLAAKVLGRANSPLYGLQMPITSVPHAITYLGMNAVRSMALSFLLEESFTADDPQLRQYYDSIWDSGLFASELCSLLAGKLGLGDTGALCTQTVLSFLGDLAAPALLGERAREVRNLTLLQRLHFEQETIGASAVLLGTIMMRAWGLPGAIIDAVAATGRVLVSPVTQLAPEHAVRAGLSYACARIGEAIAQQRIEHAEQIDLLGDESPELHHLQGYLRLPALARLPQQLQTPELRLALMRMIGAARNEATTAASS
ncbi:MAG: HDOD domain-containing protein [Pseudomonadales bacterium]|jgi:HD-like signal output (HDOD) protein|nr:HDOD domain-containing protein [Pseudomonadales bacterium]MCP5319791.1 HDOD domain-containing protein [Pseudomonadales bacterium]